MGVTLNIDMSGAISKLSGANMMRGQYAMGNQILSDSNQFVPRKEGSMRATGHLEGDASQIVWNTPYARRQFYAPDGWKYSTPGTGPRWDLKAKEIYLNDWKQAFVKGAGL